MDYLCAKIGDCTFSRFGFIVRTDRITHRSTDTADCYTDATIVGDSASVITSITSPSKEISAHVGSHITSF